MKSCCYLPILDSYQLAREKLMSTSGINTQPYSHTLLAETSQPSAPADRTQLPAVNADTPPGNVSSVTTFVSSLARQLSGAAAQAEARDASLTLGQKRNLVDKAQDMLLGASYNANKAAYDKELPASDDPDALDLAKRATQYTNGSGKNPFSGLSRDKLAVIAYDESGTFTANERRAAMYEAYDQEYAWRKQVVAEAQAEYNSTGKMTHFFQSVLEHYQSLPALEQSQYPNDYAQGLKNLIDQDFNYKTHQAEGKANYSTIINDVLAFRNK